MPGFLELKGVVAGLVSNVSVWELSIDFTSGLACCLFEPFSMEGKSMFFESTCPAFQDVFAVAFDDATKLASFSLPTISCVLPGVRAALGDQGATDSALLGIQGAFV